MIKVLLSTKYDIVYYDHRTYLPCPPPTQTATLEFFVPDLMSTMLVEVGGRISVAELLHAVAEVLTYNTPENFATYLDKNNRVLRWEVRSEA